MKLYKQIDKSISDNLVIAITAVLSFSLGLMIHQFTKLFLYYVFPHLTLKDTLPMLTALISLLFISSLINFYLYSKLNDEPQLTEGGFYKTKKGVLCPFHRKPMPAKLTYLSTDKTIKVYRCQIQGCEKEFDID